MVHGDWVEVAENDQKTTAASLNYIHFNYETHLFDRDSNKIGTWQFCEDLTFYGGDGSLGHDLAILYFTPGDSTTESSRKQCDSFGFVLFS